jgi:hypothetical protein
MDRPHVAYHVLVRTLNDDPRLAHARDTRFFAAAATVTGPTGFGMVQHERGLVSWLCKLFGLRDAIRHLAGISAWLLAANRELLRLLIEWRELRSPLTGEGPALIPLAFDEAMVVFEQAAVDDYLGRHRVDAVARRGIDRLLAACASPLFGRMFGVDEALSKAVRRQSIGRRGSFFSRSTRIAIGQDLVRQLHTGRPAQEGDSEGR